MDNKNKGPDRRGFLAASFLGAAAPSLGIAPKAAKAQEAGAPARPQGPTDQRANHEVGPVETHAEPGDVIRNPGSDFMVDLLKATGVSYVAAMPGSTFRGLHESIVTYGGNRAPELITCVHEEISAGICHGYAKVAGKPMACLVHSNVGLMHASMAIYNAWCDKVPMMILAGNGLDATKRRPGVEWLHTMTDVGAIVRDFVKWDDIPVSLQHFSESFVRAHQVATTPPYEPVLLVVDSELQEEPAADRAKLSIPRITAMSAPAGEPAAIDLAAEMMVSARSPVIVVDRVARTAEGMNLLVKLAESLNAPVIDRAGRLNIPTNHYLNHSGRSRELLSRADVILAMEVTDLWGVASTVPDIPERPSRRTIPAATKIIGISANYAYLKGNVQDSERYFAADLMLAADGQACLPQLIDAVERKLTPAQRQTIAAKKAPLEKAFHDMRAASAEDAARAWDATPIGTGRLCMEVWDQIKTLDWAFVSPTSFISDWPLRLWDITKHYQYIGYEGGYGVGYGSPSAVGAALAHREAGRIPIAIEGDGDLMVLPGSLWTLAHHQIPLLMIVHNNRAWHQETMHLQRMANRRDRGVDRWRIGTVLQEPNIDYASVARGMGVWAEGPISDPAQLKGAIARALKTVQAGKPALLDIVTQPR